MHINKINTYGFLKGWGGLFIKLSVFIVLMTFSFIKLNSWTLEVVNSPDRHRYQEMLHPFVKANLLILGNSIAANGINPRFLDTLGQRIYNFSMEGGSPSFMYDLYLKVIKKYYPKPDIVVYCVTQEMFVDSGKLLEHDSHFLPWKVFLLELFSSSSSKKTLLYNRFPILKHRDILLSKLFSNESSTPIEFKNGYMPLPEGDQNTRQLPISETVLKSKSDPEQIASFKKMIQALKAEDILVLFVEPPLYVGPRIGSHPKPRNDQDIVKQIAQDENIILLNYNEDRKSTINEDGSNFYVYDHLNEKGSEKFSTLLAKDLNVIISEVYQKKYRINPTLKHANILGKLFLSNENFIQALGYYQDALRLDPKNQELYSKIGFIFFSISQYSKAIDSYSNALLINPDYLDAMIGLAAIYDKLGSYPLAVANLKNAIRISPDQAFLQLQLGNIFVKMEKPTLAGEYFLNAIEIDPKNAPAYNNLGNVFLELGHYEKALACYQKAEKIKPLDLDIKENIRKMYPMNGHPE